jgi:hypothetical protein
MSTTTSSSRVPAWAEVEGWSPSDRKRGGGVHLKPRVDLRTQRSYSDHSWCVASAKAQELGERRAAPPEPRHLAPVIRPIRPHLLPVLESAPISRISRSRECPEGGGSAPQAVRSEPPPPLFASAAYGGVQSGACASEWLAVGESKRAKWKQLESLSRSTVCGLRSPCTCVRSLVAQKPKSHFWARPTSARLLVTVKHDTGYN